MSTPIAYVAHDAPYTCEDNSKDRLVGHASSRQLHLYSNHVNTNPAVESVTVQEPVEERIEERRNRKIMREEDTEKRKRGKK
jgi:hypothetical protein